MAAVDGVEHDLRVVAVGVGAGAEAVGVGDDARVLAHQGAVRRVLDRLPPQGQPLGRAEVLDGAEREVGALVRGADACKIKEIGQDLSLELSLLSIMSWQLYHTVCTEDKY